jgi:hypothetical protein
MTFTGAIKSRSMTWAKHVACMGKIRNAFWPENLKERHSCRWKGNITPDLKVIG